MEVLRPRAPGQADGLRLPQPGRVREEPHGRVQDRARARDVQLRRPGPRDLLRPQRRRDGRGDDQRPHPGRDLGLVPAAQRGDDAQGAEARRRVARRGAEDDLPARRQPRPRLVGRGDARRSPTSASTPARSTTSSSTSTRARAATRTSRTSSRSSRSTASAARSTSCTSAAGCPGHIRLVPKFLQWVAGRLQGLHRHLVGDRLRRALAADRDRAHRRRRRPRVLRLRRAVVGLRREYWKINGIRGISQELKERVFWRNYEELFAGRG